MSDTARRWARIHRLSLERAPRPPRSRWPWFVALAFALGFLAGARLHAQPCVESIEMIPKQAVMMQPLTRYTFTVRVRVAEHADHRLLVLAYSGGPVTSVSTRELDADAPITWSFPVRDLPGGHYVFTASVLDASGKVLGTQSLNTRLIGDDDGDSK